MGSLPTQCLSGSASFRLGGGSTSTVGHFFVPHDEDTLRVVSPAALGDQDADLVLAYRTWR